MLFGYTGRACFRKTLHACGINLKMKPPKQHASLKLFKSETVKQKKRALSADAARNKCLKKSLIVFSMKNTV